MEPETISFCLILIPGSSWHWGNNYIRQCRRHLPLTVAHSLIHLTLTSVWSRLFMSFNTEFNRKIWSVPYLRQPTTMNPTIMEELSKLSPIVLIFLIFLLNFEPTAAIRIFCSSCPKPHQILTKRWCSRFQTAPTTNGSIWWLENKLTSLDICAWGVAFCYLFRLKFDRLTGSCSTPHQLLISSIYSCIQYGKMVLSYHMFV